MQIDQPMTIGKVAGELDIPTSTARQYVKDFQHTDVFSDAATPESGQTRLFTEDDLKVMWTIKYLRAQRKPTEDIAAALVAGELYYPETETPPESRQASQDDASEAETHESAPSMGEAFTQALALYETRLAAYDDRLQDITNKWIDAEKRAERAETELRILRGQGMPETPAAPNVASGAGNQGEDAAAPASSPETENQNQQGQKKNFWDWLLRR